MDIEHRDEESIFKAAIKIKASAEREAYLERACGNDADLLARVEALLKAYAEAGDFLESPPGVERTLDARPVTEGPGTQIGRYKLLQRIGEGGFGVVYMAEQERPIRRRVALKIIKLGMDTKQVIARFEAERQALAMMEHPNIAKVFDGGATETGRPYFVMELVKGMPITEYCDQNNLDTQERLQLFIDICKAVQHAHQKGVIHRDIKPSNVMITLHDGKPVPKVIDFGIAKATAHRLTEKTLFTEYQQFIGTPEYMSPEQAEMSGLDIDTRSDIYSLGVLLYELLTGTTPFEAETLRSVAYDEIRRIIREDEPPKPSTRLSTLGETLAEIAKHRHVQPGELRRIICGDLDWIVMKSLEKDRTRRYETANDLVQDIQRHLRYEPVLAGPPSTSYRLKKFMKRNQKVVTSIAAVFAVLIGGIVTSTMFAIKANQEAKISKAVSDFLNEDLLMSAEPDNANSPEVTVHYILDVASEKIEGRLQGTPIAEATIRTTLGRTYYTIGLCVPAERHLERAIELYQDELGPEHPKVLIPMSQLGWVYSMQGRDDKAEQVFVKTLEMRRRTLGKEAPDVLRDMSHLGFLYSNMGFPDKAEPLLVEALKIQQRTLGDEHTDTLNSMQWLASLYRNQERYKEAEVLLLKALEGYQRTQGEFYSQTLWTMEHLAATYANQGLYDRAEPLYLRLLEVGRSKLGDEHPARLITMTNLENMYYDQGRYEEAKQLLDTILDIQRRVLGDEHPRTVWCLNDLARLQATCPEVKVRNGIQAIEYANTACELTGWQKAKYIDTLAAAYAEAGDFDAAVQWQKKAIELLPEQNAANDSDEYQERLNLYQSKRPYRESSNSQ